MGKIFILKFLEINLEIIYLCLTFCPNADTSAFFIKIVLTIYTHVTWHCVKYRFANYVLFTDS